MLKKLLKSFRKCFIVIKCTCLRLQKVSPLGKIKANVLRHFKVDPIGTYNLCCFCVFSNFYYCETKELIEELKNVKIYKTFSESSVPVFFLFLVKILFLILWNPGPISKQFDQNSILYLNISHIVRTKENRIYIRGEFI